MATETISPMSGSRLPDEFDRLRDGLVAHCYQMTGSYHDAEDVVQETYLRAMRGMESFEARSSLKTWLYRIATNTCITALNHRSRRVMEKLRIRSEGVAVRYLEINGTWEDHVRYAITAEEWHERRDDLLKEWVL